VVVDTSGFTASQTAAHHIPENENFHPWFASQAPDHFAPVPE